MSDADDDDQAGDLEEEAMPEDFEDDADDAEAAPADEAAGGPKDEGEGDEGAGEEAKIGAEDAAGDKVKAEDVEEVEEEPGAARAQAHAGRSPAVPATAAGLLALSNRLRRIIIVPADERVTDHRLHKNEAAAVIAMRAEQIAQHSTHFSQRPPSHDAVQIAYTELYERRCPLKLRRKVGTTPEGDDVVEEWAVREMTLPLIDLRGT
jgi:DNA-directed RNA polymerase subunit K/omega